MEINWNKVREDVTDIVRNLIRINTSNPPGNETEAAVYLQKVLGQAGINSTIYEAAPQRGNLVACLEGNGKNRPLILLAHLDVVDANPTQWTYDPFTGIIAENHIWGRGTLDMKGMLAMEVMALLLYKRSGEIPGRDLILVAAADEESGGVYGMDWLIKQGIPGLEEAEYVINEGGEGKIKDGVPVYACQNGEKGVLWVKISVPGIPGHASIPSKNNAIVKMTKILSRISRYKQPLTLCNTTRGYLAQMATQKGAKLPTNHSTLDYSLKIFANRHFSKEKSVQAMLYNTISPTVLQAGKKTNVLPDKCELTLDCRLLPGETPENFYERLKDFINDSDVSLEIIQAANPTESSTDTRLYQVIEQAVREENPKAFTVPYLSPGGTDSRFFRIRGITSYGFVPILITEAEFQRMHGIDERISLTNLEQGARILYRILREIST